MATAQQIVWEDGIEFGLSEIDVHHEQMLRRFKIFERAVAEKKQGAAGQLLKFLLTFSKEHFADEEMFLASVGYPQLQAHRAIHADFSKQLLNLAVRYHDVGETQEIIDSLRRDIIAKLIEHIQTEDLKGAEFIRKKTAS